MQDIFLILQVRSNRTRELKKEKRFKNSKNRVAARLFSSPAFQTSRLENSKNEVFVLHFLKSARLDFRDKITFHPPNFSSSPLSLFPQPRQSRSHLALSSGFDRMKSIPFEILTPLIRPLIKSCWLLRFSSRFSLDFWPD